MKAPVSLIAACLALSACAPEAGTSACSADGYESFIGQDEEVFARSTFPAPMRIIRPGQPFTEDFNADRLNFVLDAEGRIARVYCG